MEKAGGFKHYQTWKLHVLIEKLYLNIITCPVHSYQDHFQISPQKIEVYKLWCHCHEENNGRYFNPFWKTYSRALLLDNHKLKQFVNIQEWKLQVVQYPIFLLKVFFLQIFTLHLHKSESDLRFSIFFSF